MTLIGYTRIASAEEDLDSRIEALKAAGCTEIIHEYTTLRTSVRPKLMRTISRLHPGDTLIATDLDCVAWSLPQLVALLTSLRDRGIMFRALESPIDTSGPNSAVILEILRAVLSFNYAVPFKPPSKRANRRMEVTEVAAKLKATQPDLSVGEVGDELRRLGYKPPHGGTEWSRSSVRNLLARARLTGILIEE